MKPITVLLAEDHTVVREGLRALLALETDIAVVGEASTGREAVQRTVELRPTVVIMDLAMPMLNGVEATRQILQAAPATRILILSAHADDEYVDEVLELGAAGYLVKQTSSLVLAQAVREVHKGGRYLSAAISRRLEARKERIPKGKRQAQRKHGLTSRELEVLQLIAEGKANKQTAAELGISIKTVEKHRQNLMSKLNIHDSAGLTRYAIAAGVIEGGFRVTLD